MTFSLKEFLKPNKNIAATIILLPLLIVLVAGILGALFFSASGNQLLSIIIGAVLSPVVPAMFIASSFLFKFKKLLWYYLAFYIPYTIFVIIFPILVGALPIAALSGQVPDLSPLVLSFIFLDPIIVYLAFNPFFFVWLPKKLAHLTRYGSALICSAVYLLVVRYAFLFMSSFVSGQPFTYTILNIELVTDALYVALAVVFSAFIYWQFEKMLKHGAKKK